MVHCGHLLQRVSIELENSENFANVMANTVIPALAMTGTTIGSATQLASLKEVEKFTINQAVGRAYLFVYAWFTDYGPHFVKSLLKAAGKGTLQQSFPTFHPLVTTLVAKGGELRDALSCSSRSGSFDKLKKENLSLATVTFPVYTLLPFLPDVKTPLQLDFPPWNPHSTPNKPLLEWLEQPLFDFLCDHLILAPTMRVASAKLDNTSKQKGKAEWIVRGALADALVDAFDDDSVLGLDTVQSAFDSPKSLFRQAGRWESLDTISNRICKDPGTGTASARGWIRQQPALPLIQDLSQQLASHVHSMVQHLTKVSVQKSPCSLSRKKKASKVDFIGTQVAPDTPLAQLIRYEERPYFAFLSIMLRGVLGFAHAQDRNPKVLFESRSLESYSPLNAFPRADIKEFVVGRPLHHFMDQLSRWFTSADDVIYVFEAAQQANKSRNTRDRIIYTDGQCWGQYSRQLAVDGDPDVTIRERISPMFSSKVCAAWRRYWGPWYDTDPRDIPPGSLPGYKTVFTLLDELKIVGFGSGSVTRMQLANYFAIEGLCQHPTAEIMAEVTA
ncbi:hypothetical protein V5O48_019132, partial [Marasmius crinis-equi]